MKRVMFTAAMIAGLLSMASPGMAQLGWSVLPSGTNANLYSVSFPVSNVGTVVGNMATILRTTNGGSSWSSQNPSNADYFAVSFCDPDHGVAAGNIGTINATSNGGQTWNEVQYGWIMDYYAAHQMNTQWGVAAGSGGNQGCNVSVSTDGWQSYQSNSFYILHNGIWLEGHIRGVHFFNPSVGVAVARVYTGEGAVVRTENGGYTFSTVGWATHALRAVDFPTSSVGYAVGEFGEGQKTTDGGLSWLPMQMGVVSHLRGVSFVSASEGWAVGDNGIILHTTNGGTNWTLETSPANGTLNGVDFVSVNEGYAVGDNGVILRYTNNLASVVDVSMVPINPPIVLPANGGSFQFNALATNHGPAQQTFNVWARMRFPDGTLSDPTLGPVPINPPLNITVTRTRTQNIPGTYPPGQYYYIGYAALTYPGTIIDSSYFAFTKYALADGGPWVSEASCTGELFPGEQSQTAVIPSGLDLGVSPNPFNPTTVASYELRVASQVSLRVYDVSGRLVSTLADGMQEAGQHSATFDGSRLVSGMYFVKMQAGGFTAVQKLMLLK